MSIHPLRNEQMQQPAFRPEQLFDIPFHRPEPATVAALIRAGVTEQDVVAAWPYGGNAPMERTLKETDALLPHVRMVNDTLAERHTSSVQVFAARDTETLYDDFATVYPGRPSILLPASMKLWKLPAMSNPTVARGFLKTYGLTSELARDSSVDFQFNDSGFHGNAGLAFRQVLRTAYDVQDNRTAINLVHANPDAVGVPIVDGELPYDAALFKRALRLGGMVMRRPVPSLAIATALQLQPRYIGSYDTLKKQTDGTVLAISSEREHADANVDAPTYACLRMGRLVLTRRNKGSNVSVVHPLAAARAQHRVVSAALSVISQS